MTSPLVSVALQHMAFSRSAGFTFRKMRRNKNGRGDGVGEGRTKGGSEMEREGDGREGWRGR